jgi:hypothetical protein
VGSAPNFFDKYCKSRLYNIIKKVKDFFAVLLCCSSSCLKVNLMLGNRRSPKSHREQTGLRMFERSGRGLNFQLFIVASSSVKVASKLRQSSVKVASK